MSKFHRIAVLLSAGLIVFLAACSGEASRAATPTPVPLVSSYEKAVFTVSRGSVSEEVETLGEIVPSKQDELFFRASGYVNRVAFKQGDVIKQGDVLAEMQIDDLLNQLEQARIDLEVAQANAEKDKAQHEMDVARAQADVLIWEKKVEMGKIDVQNSYGADKEKAQLNLDITNQNLELAKQSMDLLSAETSNYTEQAVKRSQLAVERLEKLVAERQVIAPYDGMVLRAATRAGQQANAFNTVFQVGDPAELVIRIPYNYDLVGKITKDSEVALKMNNDATETYPVHFLPNFNLLTTVTKEAAGGSLSADYMYFSLPEGVPMDQLVVGRQVFLSIVLGKKDDVLLLPPAAIREYKGLRFVIVQEGDRRRRVEISEVGLKSTDLWEVVADLQEGDQVLGP
jgi:HlyD family secretion protein